MYTGHIETTLDKLTIQQDQLKISQVIRAKTPFLGKGPQPFSWGKYA
jgi:hypothetical protein